MNETASIKSPWYKNLSAKLLLLTVAFVMLAEVLIWTPSVARYRKNFMEDYIARSHLAMLALNSMPNVAPNSYLEQELLRQTEAHAIIVVDDDMKMLMLGADMPPNVDLTVDLNKGSFWGWVMGAFDTLAQTENRIVRAVGMPPKNPATRVEVLFDEQKMRDAILDFSVRILNLSLVISFITATLVYISLQWMIVRPTRRLTRGMVRFRENPEDPSRIVRRSSRADELGLAFKELRELQRQVLASLKQKDRLAALGAGMAKINHDLRNTLATAVLVSDRLQLIEDPEVKRVTPRLMRAIDRAIELCSQTLNYAADDSLKLRPSEFTVEDLIEDVRASMELPEDFDELIWKFEGDTSHTVYADQRHMRRALHNLCNNAVQAGATTLTITSEIKDRSVVLDIADDGPGLPEKARENLFKPFAGSSRKGGTGLGLVIVRDVVCAHGGDLTLTETGPDGTRFRMLIPRDCSKHIESLEDQAA